MRTIIGYGNSLRGEDAFGIDVVKKIESLYLEDTKVLTLYQLTPEIVLELLECDEVVFIDACYGRKEDNYRLACSLEYNLLPETLSHHISYSFIIELLNNVYNKSPLYIVYSMLTNNFTTIKSKEQYNVCIDQVVDDLTT